MVALSVTVADSRQKYVPGLHQGDFEVYEDGVRQDLAFFATDEVPLDLAILLDTSSSMLNNMPVVHEAAVGFARTLRGSDRCAVVEFKDSVQVLQPLTADVARLESAIRQTTALRRNRRGTGEPVRARIRVEESDGERKLPPRYRSRAFAARRSPAHASRLSGRSSVTAGDPIGCAATREISSVSGQHHHAMIAAIRDVHDRRRKARRTSGRGRSPSTPWRSSTPTAS